MGEGEHLRFLFFTFAEVFVEIHLVEYHSEYFFSHILILGIYRREHTPNTHLRHIPSLIHLAEYSHQQHRVLFLRREQLRNPSEPEYEFIVVLHELGAGFLQGVSESLVELLLHGGDTLQQGSLETLGGYAAH